MIIIIQFARDDNNVNSVPCVFNVSNTFNPDMYHEPLIVIVTLLKFVNSLTMSNIES